MSFRQTIAAEELLLAVHGWLRNLRFHGGLYLYWKSQPRKRPGGGGVGEDDHDEELPPPPDISNADRVCQAILDTWPPAEKKTKAGLRELLKNRRHGAFRRDLAGTIQAQFDRLRDHGLIRQLDEWLQEPAKKRPRKDGKPVEKPRGSRHDWRASARLYEKVPLLQHTNEGDALRKALGVSMAAFPH